MHKVYCDGVSDGDNNCDGGFGDGVSDGDDNCDSGSDDDGDLT